MYAVGDSGAIGHYDGNSWQIMERATDVRILDLWGSTDGKTVWACGRSPYDGSAPLALQASAWQTLWDSRVPSPSVPYSDGLTTLWTSGSGEFMVADGAGRVFRHSLLDLTHVEQESVALGGAPVRVRGSGKANVFVACREGKVWHFNGATWMAFPGLLTDKDVLYGLAVTDNMVIITGCRYTGADTHSALVVVGRRG